MSHFLKVFGERNNPSSIYLDYAAATPVRREVMDSMQPYYRDCYANPSAIHKEGQRAREAVETARKKVADTLATRPDEITFTSGGTEANNLAILGVVEAAIRKGRSPSDIKIISTPIEHPSVLESLEKIKEIGVHVVYIPVDEGGRIVRTKLKEYIDTKTLLVTFAYVNSEVGVVEDVKRITHQVRLFKKEHSKAELYVHLDASQAPLWLPCKVNSLGVDLMTLDSGKVYGPKGVGVLVHKAQVPVYAQTYGGDQESELRAGTENVAGVVGCATALNIAQEHYEKRSEKVSKLRDYLIEGLTQNIEKVFLNGSREHRVANNVNISAEGIDGEYAVVTLDVRGVAASTKSACSGAKGGGSHVVRTLTGDNTRAEETIRFTLGEGTTVHELDIAIRILKDHVTHMHTKER